MKSPDYCSSYVGYFCVNGLCPLAIGSDDVDSFHRDFKFCRRCFFNQGCEDCAMYFTDECPRKDSR